MFLKRLKSLSMLLLSATLILSNQNLSVLAATYSDSNIEDEILIDTVEIKKGENVKAADLIENFKLNEKVEKTIEVKYSDEVFGKLDIKEDIAYHVVYNDTVVWNSLDEGDLELINEGVYQIYKGDINYTVSFNEETKSKLNDLTEDLATKQTLFETAEKALKETEDGIPALQAAVDDAQTKYDNASNYKDKIKYGTTLAAAKTALESAKKLIRGLTTAKNTASDNLKNAETALNNYKSELKESDLSDKVTFEKEYSTESASLKSGFTLYIYNELEVVTNGVNVAPQVTGTHGITEKGKYKVYLSDSVKVIPTTVPEYKVTSTLLDGVAVDLTNTFELTEDAKLEITYTKAIFSDLQLEIDNKATVTVTDGSNEYADGDVVEEGTKLTVNVDEVADGYEVKDITVKAFNAETEAFDIEVTLDGTNSFVVGKEATTYLVEVTTKYVASQIKVEENEFINKVILSESTNVADGTTVEFTIETLLGYEVKTVKVVKTGTEEEITLINDNGVYSFVTVGGTDYTVKTTVKSVMSQLTPGSIDFDAVQVKVTVNGKNKTFGKDTTEIGGLVEGDVVKITLTPVNGNYVSDAVVTLNGEKPTQELTTKGKGVYELTFTSVESSVYSLTVETKKPVLELSGNTPVVNKYDTYTNDYEQIKTDILSQGFNKAEGLSNDDITVKYYAGSINILVNIDLWLDLNVDAQTYTLEFINDNWPSWLPGKDSLIESIKTTIHDFGQLEEEKIRVEFSGNDQYPGVQNIETTALIEDLRLETLLDVNKKVEVVYGEYTDEELLALILDGKNGITDAEGNLLPEFTAEVKLDATYAGANAGTYTIIAEFDDQFSYEYRGCKAEVTLIVHKAKSETTINSTVTEYGINIDNLISTTPEDIKHASFVLGLDIEKQSTLIHVNLPELVDLSELPAALQNIIKPILDSFSTWEGSLSDLAPYLESLLKTLESVEGNDYINLDTDSIKTLVDILTKVSNLEGIGNVTIKLTINQDITPKNAGAYLVGAVTTDNNYETSYGLGYLVIKPQTTKVELAFNVVDENGFITSKAIKDGYDLGSHIVNDAAPAEYLTNIYFGVTIDGEYYIANEPTSTIGAYSQLAYIFNVGNEMYYATPIVRAYAVISDIVNVDFAEGKEVVVEFDNKQHELTPVVTDRNGTPLTAGTLTLRYVGVQTNGQLYNDVVAPKNSGVYGVIATYIEKDGEDVTNVGMGVASLVIKPTQSTVTVDNAFHVYDENKFDLTQLVDAKSTVENITPDTTVITFKIEADGDVSENGINGITNVINVDLPKWLDKVLKENGKFEAAYKDGYLLANELTKYLDTISNTLVEKDLISQEGIEEIIAQLKQLPTDVKVTLLETKEVSPYAVGIYGVVAIVTDSDHLPAVDYGVLVISPEFTKAELEWNYVDANGIITTPVLKDVDFNASAFVESVLNEQVTNKVQYLFIGLDKDGKFVTTTDASDLTIGAYTEIAYVVSEIGVEIFVVEPIVRSFVVTPQTVDVTFVDENGNENNDRIFVYNGQPQGMDVVVKEMNGSVITGERLENLSVVYTGITTSGEKYNSTTRPTDAGVYTVVAEYYEVNEKGDLLHTGMEVGYMVIKPGKAELEVVDTTVTYDGNEHMATINNPENLTLITIVVDEKGNVNINLPVVTYATARAISLENAIELISHYINNEEVLEQLKQFVEDLNVRVVTINGENPVEVGTYKVYAIGFDANFELTIDNGTLVIEKQETTDPEDPTDPTDPKDPVDPEDPTDPKDPVDPEKPTDKPADKEETDKPVTPEKPADKEETNKPVDPEEKPESPVTSDTVYVGLSSLMALLSVAILLVLRKKAELSK